MVEQMFEIVRLDFVQQIKDWDKEEPQENVWSPYNAKRIIENQH
jgi:hypothetical protein